MRMKRSTLRSHLWPIIFVAVLSGSGEQSHVDNDEASALASVEVFLTPDRQAIRSIQYGWRFDQNFSAQMLESFDESGDARLNAAELREASQSVYDTIKAYRYFLLLSRDGSSNPVDIKPPSQMAATYRDSKLSVSFEAKLTEPLPLTGRIEIGLFDPTFSINFDDASTIRLADRPGQCSSENINPDFDAVVAQNPKALNDSPEEDPDGGKTIALFASRLVIICKPS